MDYEENEGIDLSVDTSEYDEEQSKEMKTDFNNQQDSKVEVKFKKVFHDCKLPSLATSGAAAYDLYSCTQKIIKPGERVKFSLGFKMLLLHNYCAKIYSRSGLAAKHGIHVSGGTAIIDSDFLGPMAVWLINLDNNNSYKVKFHDWLAQMTFEPVTQVEWSKGTDANFDVPTEQSPTGFGSTGK